MIWKDNAFREIYRAQLDHAHTHSDAEARAQAQAFQAEAVRLGASRPDHFTHRAGAAATAMLSGYVKSALDAFDGALASVEAELEESDLTALRESLEQEIARRSKALPASLRDFCRPTEHPALLRTILQQAPVKARQILLERVTSARDRIRTQVQAHKLLDRAIFISHDAGDSNVAESLKTVILQAVGSDAPLYTSSELEGLRARRDGCARVLEHLKKSRMTLAVVTPESRDNPWLWWTVGIAAGAGKPVFVVRAKGVSTEVAFPIDPTQDIDLAQRDDVVRLLQAVQGEVRRRPEDPSAMDLSGVLSAANVA